MKIASFLSALAIGLAPASAKMLLLLPVDGDLEKSSDLSTVNELYQEAVQNIYKGDVRAPRDTGGARCGGRDCALQLAGVAKADEVIFTNIKRLGGKWIFSSTIMNASGGEVFNQRATAQTLEDLEPVTRRVADALLSRKTVEQVATVDNITAKEENSEPTRRRSLYSTGLSLGYLYPVDNSYAYLRTGNGSSDRHYSQLVRFTWLNSWEFRDNLMLGFDAMWAVPHVIGGDLNLQYMFSKTDFSPFLGGGVGLHFVGGDDSGSSDHRYTGPALNAQAGMMFFRTYDIHVMARTQYQVIFNSNVDHGVSFDVGVVYQKKKSEGGGGDSGWGSFWKYYLIAALAASVIGAMAN